MEKNITSISWRQKFVYKLAELRVADIHTFYPNLMSLRIFVGDELLREVDFVGWTVRWGDYVRHNVTLDLISHADLTAAFRSRGRYLDGLKSIRGLADFSWVVESNYRGEPRESSGRFIIDMNWQTFSEWVQEQVSKGQGT